MEVVFFYIMFVIVVGFMASAKARTPLGWMLLAVLISPLFAGIILLCLSSLKAQKEHIKSLTCGAIVKCGACAEFIKAEANVCKHCGTGVTTEQLPISTSTSNNEQTA